MSLNINMNFGGGQRGGCGCGNAMGGMGGLFGGGSPMDSLFGGMNGMGGMFGGGMNGMGAGNPMMQMMQMMQMLMGMMMGMGGAGGQSGFPMSPGGGFGGDPFGGGMGGGAMGGGGGSPLGGFLGGGGMPGGNYGGGGNYGSGGVAPGSPFTGNPSEGGAAALNSARSFLGQRSRDIRGQMPNFRAAGGLTNNCADFVSSALQNGGMLGGHEVSVKKLEQRLIREGWRQIPQSQARAGDVIFNQSRGHVQLAQGNGMQIGSNNVRQGLQYITEGRMGANKVVYSKR